MTPRKTAGEAQSKKEKRPSSSGRSDAKGVLQRTSLSVASIKEKTKQGLKRLTSKSSLGQRKTNQRGSSGSSGLDAADAGPTVPKSAAVNKAKKAVDKKNSSRSPAVKVFRPRSDENTPQRNQPPRKVKLCKGPKGHSDGGLEKRRIPVSMSSTLQEMKGNVAKAVETMSLKLGMGRVSLAGGRRGVRPSTYDSLLSSDTPVKLYSPFAINEFEHTPNGASSGGGSARAVRRSRASSSATSTSRTTTPKGQLRSHRLSSAAGGLHNVSRNLLDTPTGKFRQDLDDMTKGFEELTSLTRRLRDRTEQDKIWS